jgi:hypothetical protein
MAHDDDIQELTDQEKARWDAVGRAIGGMAAALGEGSLDIEGVQAVVNQVRSIDVDPERFLDSLHVPDDAGEHAESLARILQRIPSRWGRWVSCDAGWYPLVIRVDAQLLELDPDYEVHQIKQDFAALDFKFATAKGLNVWQAMRAITDAAREESRRTCERCGRPGRTSVRDGWYKTLCDGCSTGLRDGSSPPGGAP